MSSEPIRIELFVCPDCGAELTAGDECWLCHGRYSEAARTPAKVAATTGSFSLSSLLLIMTLVAVGLGLIVTAPGLGIPVCILLAPVMLRTLMVVERRKALGIETSSPQKVGLVAVSLIVAIVIAVVVAVAAVGTFCFVCVSVGRGGEIPAAIAGLAIAAFVCMGMGAWVRNRYRRDTMRERPQS